MLKDCKTIILCMSANFLNCHKENKTKLVRSHLACWLCLSALMHFPRMSSDVLMFPASLRRSPLFWVLAHRSEPARSHRLSLMARTFRDIRFFQLFLLWKLKWWWFEPVKLIESHLLTDSVNPRGADIFNPQNANGEDAVAAGREEKRTANSGFKKRGELHEMFKTAWKRREKLILKKSSASKLCSVQFQCDHKKQQKKT